MVAISQGKRDVCGIIGLLLAVTQCMYDEGSGQSVSPLC